MVEEQNYLMKALAQEKRIGNLLNEVQDISQQLAEAVDRDDQVSVEMLVAMRREPIEKLQMADQALRDLIAAIKPPEEGRRLAELLNGAQADSTVEHALADQVAVNNRRLKQVLELDKVVNCKLSRGKSAYS